MVLGEAGARSASHLAGLAVAKTSAPRCRASCTAAMPTPPAPACTSTRSPALQPGQVDAGRSRRCRNTIGTAAACSKVQPSGIGASSCASATATGPNAPGTSPITRSPTPRSSTPGPTSRTTPAPSPPSRAAPGVDPERHQHVAEVQPGGAHLDPHRPPVPARRSGHPRERAKPVQCAALGRRQVPSAWRRHQRSGPRQGRAQSRHQRQTLTQSDLGLGLAEGERALQGLARGLAAVAVDQGETTRALRLGRAQESQDRRRDGVCVLDPVDRYGALTQHGKARPLRLLGVGDPPLGELERGVSDHVRRPGRIGGPLREQLGEADDPGGRLARGRGLLRLHPLEPQQARLSWHRPGEQLGRDRTADDPSDREHGSGIGASRSAAASEAVHPRKIRLAVDARYRPGSLAASAAAGATGLFPQPSPSAIASHRPVIVIVYVVVAFGVTLMVPRGGTAPTPLSIVGVPASVAQDSSERLSGFDRELVRLETDEFEV